MTERETAAQAGNWLVGTVRRNPEALLVLAAGCALLMRSKSGGSDASRQEDHYYDPAGHVERPNRTMTGATESARQYASDAASGVSDTAKQYASNVASGVTDAASGVTDAAGRYATTISDYSGEVRDAVSSGVSQFPDQARATVQQGFARILREQPLAIAAMGLAAGAAMAAIFPASETESPVLKPAHDAVVDAASRAAENVKVAAGQAGEQLKQAAQERGLDPDGLKGLAREVAGNFADNVKGRSTNQDRNPDRNPNEAPSLVPEYTGGGSSS